MCRDYAIPATCCSADNVSRTSTSVAQSSCVGKVRGGELIRKLRSQEHTKSLLPLARSGQNAYRYFHGVKTRLSTLETGDVPRGSDST